MDKFIRNSLGRTVSSILLAASMTMALDVSAEPIVAASLPVPSETGLISELELQEILDDLEGFMAQVDRQITGVLAATEDYRTYVGHVQQMLASCEVEADSAGFEGTGFTNLIGEGRRECDGWVEGFNQMAMTYAAQLDEAIEFQKVVEKVGERLQFRMDRVRIAMQASRVASAVDQGLEELDESRAAFSPWMD